VWRPREEGRDSNNIAGSDDEYIQFCDVLSPPLKVTAIHAPAIVPMKMITRHADFQTGVSKLLAICFNELAGRPSPNLHYNTQLSHAELPHRCRGS